MVTLGDIERAIASRDPRLAALLVRYLEQDDPEPGRSELLSSDDDELALDDDDVPDDDDIDVPAGAVTLATLSQAVSDQGLANKTATERKLARRAAFAAAEASAFAPPRLKLGALLLAVYEQGEPEGRAALLEVFATGTMKWGVWQAAKAIYKRAEERHDAAMWGVLAYRFDAMRSTPHVQREIGAGTLVYLRRRAWRYLRLLGQAVLDAYPTFAVEVLRHYPANHNNHASSWVAAQIWNHASLKGARGSASFATPRNVATARAFPQAWKLAPAPLLRLLDAANNDIVCNWAIACLRADHPLALRAVEPAWLARLAQRPVAAIHAFVVALLRESPELHQSKLRELGLHDAVIGFLRSPSSDARAYALEYAAAHAQDLPVADLVELVESGATEVAKFAAARLEAMPPAQLGVDVLLRLLGRQPTAWAADKLTQGFAPSTVTEAQFVDVAARGTAPFNLLIKYFNERKAAIPAGHWRALLDDERFVQVPYSVRSIVQSALTELGKRKAAEIGIPWIQQSLENRLRTDAVVRWLDAGMLSGDQLDVDWLKSLVAKPRLRDVALKLLGDRRRVAPARVGLGWLLELARSSDAALAQFAQRMLLESFEPADFADGNAKAGVQRLWDLAAGPKSPEAVRGFAATYLKAHHPELGPRQAEAKALGIKPRLVHADYPLATVRPLLFDARADVRRLAAAIASEEIVRWDEPALVYELASATHKEPRALGSELLLSMLNTDAPRIPAAWIDGRRLFQLAESSHKVARETALTLIRRLYERVGGAERLAWLMDSPERDVRLFAVRLFWDRHRPTPWPADYVPRKATGASTSPARPGEAALPNGSAVLSIGTSRFSDVTSLRQFARTVLFGLPPGRLGERDAPAEGAPAPERPLPASVAKRRLIEALRDVALEDVELARAVSPVLGELAASIAKGEWQASVQALTALRAHHAEAL